jgi:DNA-binding transcriptional MerR regulator
MEKQKAQRSLKRRAPVGEGVKMAKSPAHRFGQIIGDLLELTIINYCRPIAEEYGMYLDYKHKRPARNGRKEVIWADVNENKHKLDIVIEEKGSEFVMGHPRAFIEMAWRRYTKHSKNKAQEISGAIKPLISRYNIYLPFFGAVLAGDFTDNSLRQLKSEGFRILYFSMAEIEKAFATQGIDAHWEEDTPEEELQKRVEQYEALTQEQTDVIAKALLDNNQSQLTAFCDGLRDALQSKVTGIDVVTLYGSSNECSNAADACAHISKGISTQTLGAEHFYQYEIVIKYSNGEKIPLPFQSQEDAVRALNKLF